MVTYALQTWPLNTFITLSCLHLWKQERVINVITVIKFSRTSFNRRCAICKFYWVQIYHINRSCLATDGEEKQQSCITFLYPAVLCNHHVQTLKEVASQQTRRRSQIVAQFFTEHQNLVGQQLAQLVAPALWKWRNRWVFAREASQFLGPQFLLWFHNKWDLKIHLITYIDHFSSSSCIIRLSLCPLFSLSFLLVNQKKFSQLLGISVYEKFCFVLYF